MEVTYEMVLADFKEWSGGAEPSECYTKVLKDYAETSCPFDLSVEEIVDILS